MNSHKYNYFINCGLESSNLNADKFHLAPVKAVKVFGSCDELYILGYSTRAPQLPCYIYYSVLLPNSFSFHVH